MGSGPDRLAPDRLPPDPAAGARANALAALTLLEALQRRGLRHLVLCPGSRSAPLAVAAALLEPGGLRLHTAIDERSAAFFALGLGRAQGRPAAVVTTSGTAVAQLLAAAVEADLGTIPLLLLSADRPEQLKNCGANQAVPQERFLLASCRRLLQGPPRGLAAATAAQLEQLAGEAMETACGDGRTAPAGPVHLNLPFAEPLHVDGADVAALISALATLSGAAPAGSGSTAGLAETSWTLTDSGPAAATAAASATAISPSAAALAPVGTDATLSPAGSPLSPAAGNPASPLAGGPVDAAAPQDRSAGALPDEHPSAEGAALPGLAAAPPASSAPIPRLDPDRPGVVVAGPWRGTPQEWPAHVAALRSWQRRSGWPLLADTLSGLRGLQDLELVSAYDALLETAEMMPPAGQVLRLGTLPASRRLQRWLEACGGHQVLVSQGDPRRLDPLGVVSSEDQWSGGLAGWVEAVVTASGPTGTEGEPPAACQAPAQLWRELESAAQAALERELGDAEGSQRLMGAPGTAHAESADPAIAGDLPGAAGGSRRSLVPGTTGDDHDNTAGEAAAGTDRADGGSDQGEGRGQGRGDAPGADHAPGDRPGIGAGPDADAALRVALSSGISGGFRGGTRSGVAAGTGPGPDHEAPCLDTPPLSEPWLARALSRLLPPGLPVMLASSSPVRDWESFTAADAPWRPIHGFRGASGIDGTLSIACGLAEALGQLVLVSGDLALLHDANGWLWARQLRGRLTVVLIENGGGGIFEQLPIRTQPPERLDFERLFAMPQNVDQLALAALHGVPGRRLRRAADLDGDLAWALEQPFALLELHSNRQDDASLRRRLRQAACAAAAGPAGRMAGQELQRR